MALGKKILTTAKVILAAPIFLDIKFFTLVLSSVHRIPTRTSLEAGGTLLVLVGLLFLTSYLEKKLGNQYPPEY